jgi:hypothetical protein
LVAAGIAGAVNPGNGDIAMITDQDLGSSFGYGNKLDYYIDRSLTMNVVVGKTSAAVTETLTMSNHVPNGLGPYIVGVRNPGTLSELVALAVPAGATDESFTSDGRPAPAQSIVGDGSNEIRTVATISQGDSVSWQLSYSMPVVNGNYSLIGVPQPLAVPASLRLDITASSDDALTGEGPTVVTNNQVSRSGAWNGEIKVQLHVGAPGVFTRLRHGIAHFWTHKVRVG